MTEVSRQFSLREIIGTVAPGAMVLSSVLYVLAKTPAISELGSVGSGWGALLVGFVVAYGIGTLLTSLTQTVFATVTQMGKATALPGDPERGAGARLPAVSDRIAEVGDRVVKRAVSYLSGGQDITSSIRHFRESWEVRAVDEGVVSPHAFAMTSAHYRTLFGHEPSGEESLLFCEFYIRERMPSVMQEIEQDAAKAALLGNLIIPMLFWLFAVGAGILLSLFNQPQLVGTLVQFLLFAILLVVFPYVVRLIGRQWVDASRHYVRIVIITFTIACRLAANTASAAVPAFGAMAVGRQDALPAGSGLRTIAEELPEQLARRARADRVGLGIQRENDRQRAAGRQTGKGKGAGTAEHLP